MKKIVIKKVKTEPKPDLRGSNQYRLQGTSTGVRAIEEVYFDDDIEKAIKYGKHHACNYEYLHLQEQWGFGYETDRKRWKTIGVFEQAWTYRKL